MLGYSGTVRPTIGLFLQPNDHYSEDRRIDARSWCLFATFWLLNSLVFSSTKVAAIPETVGEFQDFNTWE